MKCQIALLCYGTVAGGFLSERWLGQPEPGTAGDALTNRSLIKYKLIIDDFGGWDLLQQLLEVLATAAARHGTDIATVASRAILDRPQVAAVIDNTLASPYRFALRWGLSHEVPGFGRAMRRLFHGRRQ